MKKLVFIFGVSLLLYSCDDIIEVEDISNKVITILAPTDGSTLNNNSINFSWNAIEDAENYRLQIAFPDFENTIAIEEDTIVTSTNFSKALNSGNYEWRVRAVNSGFQTAYTTQAFSVSENDAVDISNEEVVLLAPANSLVFSTTDIINFSWETELNADSYTIQIATPDFVNAIEIIENETVMTTSFSVSNLESQEYEWRVKAQNSDFETMYTTQSFAVEE